MSDYWILRGIDASDARPVFEAWTAKKRWVRSVELRNGYELQELEINRKPAGNYQKGKHKVELAELVVLLQKHGGRVIHVMLHRHVAERLEEDMSDWAEGVLDKSAT
jgi:hypothetical protein